MGDVAEANHLVMKVEERVVEERVVEERVVEERVVEEQTVEVNALVVGLQHQLQLMLWGDWLMCPPVF